MLQTLVINPLPGQGTAERAKLAPGQPPTPFPPCVRLEAAAAFCQRAGHLRSGDNSQWQMTNSDPSPPGSKQGLARHSSHRNLRSAIPLTKANRQPSSDLRARQAPRP